MADSRLLKKKKLPSIFFYVQTGSRHFVIFYQSLPGKIEGKKKYVYIQER